MVKNLYMFLGYTCLLSTQSLSVMEKSVAESAEADFFRTRVYGRGPNSKHKLITHIVILVFTVLNYYIPAFR